ncbi:uncharacterized protein [Euphorbia lathyris]|uniref:uncharacterized protein n=1 Tax=Euphorbia lathyris TaxID=212925 RepID=UPI0033131C27
MTASSSSSILKLSLPSSSAEYRFLNFPTLKFYPSNSTNLFLSSSPQPLQFSHRVKATPIPMEAQQSGTAVDQTAGPNAPINLLFVEMGVGYDQHGQDITVAAMRACKDAISSNSIPAFRRGSIPGVSFGEMKLQIKLGVPQPLQQSLDIERVKSVFPYGKILNVEVVDGGLICSSGVCVEEMGDKNDDCYIVNAAVYVGY